MKRALSLVLFALPVIPLGACSSSEAPPEYPAGGSGSAVAGSTAQGGSSSQAGTSSTGGGSAGTPSTAGTSSGGTGTAGTGAGGVGGTGTGGSAGTPTGGTGTGGTAGGAGGSGGSGGGAPAAVSVGKLDGFLLQTPCKPSGTDDCDSGGWIYEGKTYPLTGGKLDTNHDSTKDVLKFAVTGGEPGKVYAATMHFYGIMEPKNYGNAIAREAAPMRPGLNSPSSPPPFAKSNMPGATFTVSDYNTYEVHVYNEKNEIVGDYYLNADSQEGHYTFVIDYERTIDIVAGGFIKVRSYDNNGRMIKNCGTTGAGTPCAGKAQSVASVSAAMPAITVQQPGLGLGAGDSGQWFAIDVKTIAPK